MQDALEYNRKSNLDIEKLMTPYTILQELVLQIAGIEFSGVHFSYENKEILHGIDAVLPDRSTTAVIGPSGSGKTTLCNLIARFWDVDSGSGKKSLLCRLYRSSPEWI